MPMTLHHWVLCKHSYPTENGYYDTTTEPIAGIRILHERWYFQESKIKSWQEAKVVAWRKSLDHIPYEGEI